VMIDLAFIDGALRKLKLLKADNLS